MDRVLQYMVFQIDNGGSTYLKGVFTDYTKADNLAKKLYKSDLDYFKSEGTYDTVQEGQYRLFQQAFGGGQELVSSYIVNEIEYELDQPCEIELN